MSSIKYVIIGGGPAALSAARVIYKRDPGGSLVVIRAEKHQPYYRPLISYFLAGQVGQEILYLHQTNFYNESKLRLIHARVIAVHGKQKNLTLEIPEIPDKVELSFERLLIATGAEPVKPELPGRDRAGVFFLRTIDDAVAIGRRAKQHRRAVIVGGGLVGLRAACALSKLGLKIILVVSSAQVLSRMLDPEGAALVAQHLEKQGMQIYLKSDVDRIHGGVSGVTGVTLAGGTELEAGLVVIGKGVQPATAFLKGSEVQVSGGIPVNEKLQTNLPHVYAAGDAALCRDLFSGEPASHPLWTNAVAQGEIAGANMAGKELTYRGSMGMNATEILGLPVMAAGLVTPDAGDPAYEIYTRRCHTSPGAHSLYTKIVIRDNKLVGYVVIGAERKAGILTNLILNRRGDVSSVLCRSFSKALETFR